MRKVIEMIIAGIKCDNTLCDYEDMSIPSDEYPSFLGKECPKCGDNLLTYEDYEHTLKLEKLANKINVIAHKLRWINPIFYWYKIFGRPVNEDVIKTVHKFPKQKKRS